MIPAIPKGRFRRTCVAVCRCGDLRSENKRDVPHVSYPRAKRLRAAAAAWIGRRQPDSSPAKDAWLGFRPCAAFAPVRHCVKTGRRRHLHPASSGGPRQTDDGLTHFGFRSSQRVANLGLVGRSVAMMSELQRRERRPIADCELPIDVMQMDLDCAIRDIQQAPDLFIG
jgi:hypothetical protein